MALVAENGGNPRFSGSYERMAKLVEGISSLDKKAHGDALKQERNSLEAKMARRQLRVHALEPRKTRPRSERYNVREDLGLAKMEKARKVEENGITRLKLTREVNSNKLPSPRQPEEK